MTRHDPLTPGRRMVLVIVVALGGIASLAGAGGHGPAPARSIDPVSLHRALLALPIDESQLPPGFAGVRLIDVAVTSENAAVGEIANIDVTIADGPDQLNGGAYTIYATPAQAEAAIAALLARLGANPEAARAAPALSEWPTFVVTATMPNPPLGVTAYLIRMDSVVVAAFSGVLDQATGNADHARALAVLMAQQVERLSRKHPG